MQINSYDFITIDRRSAVSYDFQIKERIKALIIDQTFHYKSVLPQTSLLAKKLSIEEKHVNLAYKQLIFERYVKQDDKGSYIVSFFELTNYFFDRNTAVYDAIIALGLEPSIECVGKRVVTLNQETINKMGFDTNKSNQYFYINRIYKGDNKPIMVLENYLPLYLFPDMPSKFVGNEPLNEYLTKHYDSRAFLSQRKTKAVNLNQTLANLLNERNNAASLQSTNRVYNKHNQLMDYGRSHTISSYYFQNLIEKKEITKHFPSIDYR